MIKTKVALLVLATMFIGSCTSQLPVGSSGTATDTPQAIYTLTPTSTSIITLSLTPTLTWTSLPTLSVHEREAKIRELLETTDF